ncbi:DUF481 domain-containing protein [candidate division KSB1 bacterium]
MKKFAFLLLIFAFFFSSYAQVNIEKFRKTGTEDGFSGYVQMNVSSQSGNVELTMISFESRGDYIKNNMNTFIILRTNSGWKSGNRYANSGLAHLRHIFGLGENLQPEVFSQVEYNKQRLMLFRGLFGGGVRISILKNDKSRLWWGTSMMYEHERLDKEKVLLHSIKDNVFRWSNYLSAAFVFRDGIKFSLTSYFQPQIDGFNDIRIFLESNLDVQLSEKLSLGISFRLRDDSRPPDNVKATDTNFMTGLRYQF